MWCYTDEASKEWEYCAPPGEVSPFFSLKLYLYVMFAQVLDTAYTVNGQDCIGECATQDEDYW